MRSTKDVIGRVIENCSCSTPSFSVYDKNGHSIMSIGGPSCSSVVPCYLGGNVVFHITDTRNGAAVGSIMKRFAMREVLTDSNDFGFSILADTDEVTKAILIGAVFCIVSGHTYRIAMKRSNELEIYSAFINRRILRFSGVSLLIRTQSIGNGAVGNAHSVLSQSSC